MAQLIKGGARKPRIEKGPTWADTGWDPVKREMTYNLTVASAMHEGPTYVARLDEEEMIATMATWMGYLGSDRKRQKKLAAKDAA